MSSSQAPRAVHQDYIARIRYTNTLPPPPNPPKLLDIPNTGLTSGQYTQPGFASRLAREQPLNIEADAELGMPLDLVGMPGIFDGDESSIQAPSTIPAPHPHDRALLKPLSSLGKPKFSDTGVSFLRRTEYISSHTSKSRFDSTTSKSLINNTGNRGKRVAADIDKEAPEAIKKVINEGFIVAANSLKALGAVRHPTKLNVKVVEAFPVLPDQSAFTDAGGYVEIKFQTNPVPPSSTYDTRLERGLFRPLDLPEEEQALIAEMAEAHKRDPERNPAPEVVQQFEFFTAETAEEAVNFKRVWDPLDPEHDSESLYPPPKAAGERCFRFKKMRTYESGPYSGGQGRHYDDEVVVALHDGKDGLRQKAAYYYPIMNKLFVKPQRNRHIEAKRLRQHANDDGERFTDFIDVRVKDPDEKTLQQRTDFIEYPWGKDEEPVEETVAEVAVADGNAESQNVDAEGEEDAQNSDE